MITKLFLLYGLTSIALTGETGRDAWLRYGQLERDVEVPSAITILGSSELLYNARKEMMQGVRGMLAKTLRVEAEVPPGDAIILGTLDDLRSKAPKLALPGTLLEDAYWLKTVKAGGARYTVITGANDRGVLYGAFAWLRKLGTGESISTLDEKRSPHVAVRWVNQWDNLNGSIERGYGGRSIFWDKDHVQADLSRVSEYGRLLASLGINGCAVNNVNSDKRILTPAYLPELANIAEALRPWGVRTVISVDFGSPQSVGALDTFDPLDPRVAAWWQSKVDEIYRAIPDLAGVVMKADSEGRVGPSAYKRTHADAANVVARALKPHGGLIFYRGFVYDHHMDWRNLKNDRARAAYDNFVPLDGKFDQNVVIQIKHGPIDFQVREPASPLFGALRKTNQSIELQITQEYFGQGRHNVFLVPMWKEALDFDMHVRGPGTPVKALAKGGFIGVANVGLNDDWLGNQLSQADLYGFGRLAWNPDLSSRQIAEEWTRLTFGNDPKVVQTIAGMQLSSWRTYENYTGPLGLQTLTDIVGNHYGVAVEASERNGWGQWHRADEKGVGMDRTAAGTGYIEQYRPDVARFYGSLETCPDDLLLFMHHVPYNYQLHSGKTVIQYIYDSHYEGAAAVARAVNDWTTLKGRVDDQRFEQVRAQLEYQAGQAELWRDAVSTWFLKASGIEDAKGRVGHYPGRVEAESMELGGFKIRAVTPWETASGGKAVVCEAANCTAMLRYKGPAGWHTLRVRYFDTNDGASQFRLMVEGQVIDEWLANDRLPTRKLDGTSSSLRIIRGVALRTGDEIRIIGAPDGAEKAALDYLEIAPNTLISVARPRM